MVLLKALVRPLGKTDITSYFHSDESDFYEAYKAHLDIADLLASSSLYWDAVYHLRFSVECFLKYTFCLIRKAHLNINNPSQVSVWLTNWTIYKYPFKKYLHASNFSHDLRRLRTFFENETDAGVFVEFKDLITHFPSESNWVDDRYRARQHSNYKQKFSDFRRDFNSALNGPFNGVQ